jgi:glucose/arabinose dehydrogenase
MKKILTILGIIAVIVVVVVYLFVRNIFKPDTTTPLAQNIQTGEPAIVAQNLHVPWGIVVLPTGELLATERNGAVQIIGTTTTRAIQISDVVERGEGGLLGVTLHPNYASNTFIYLYYTTQSNTQTINRVVRFTYDGTTLTHNKIILDAIPGASNHNGGGLAFGPDGYLYIATGDASNDISAQDTHSLAGKILRVTDEGAIPADNPFNNAVYSYGHRNPQGLAWDAQGGLWATEHGRSGLQSGLDEINFIEKGANYGWPVIEGDATRSGMKTPVIHSGPTSTWAPSGLVFFNNKLYFAGLRGQALYEVPIVSEGKLGNVTAHFKSVYGRIRALTHSPDGTLYFSTSNQDGRGTVQQGDDKIIQIKF